MTDPEHLHGGERRLLEDGGSQDRHADRHNIHRQLELEELGDALVHVAAPQCGGDDVCKVIFEEDL